MNAVVESETDEKSPVSLDLQADNIDQLSEISKNSRTTFFALVLACVYSFLTIAATSDSDLLSNTSTTALPIIQVNVRIIWFYYFAPVILSVLFIYFHLYLERFWRGLIRLPLEHPDGRGLDDYVYPWMISSSFIRGELNRQVEKLKWLRFESLISLALGWCLVPFVLLFYWGRYLVTHDTGGILLHVVLILVTTGFSFRFYYAAKNALRSMSKCSNADGHENEHEHAVPPVDALNIQPRQILVAVTIVILFGFVLLYLSYSATRGLEEDKCRTAIEGHPCQFYSNGIKFFKTLEIRTHLDINQGRFIDKPDNWQTLLSDPSRLWRYLDNHENLVLENRNLHQLKAIQAFLPASRIKASRLDYSDLQHAVLSGSTLDDVIFSGADLTNADFQHSIISNSKFDNVFAEVSNFSHAKISAPVGAESTKFSGNFYDARFEQIDGNRLLFETTNLNESYFVGAKVRYSEFIAVEMAGAKLENAELTENEFTTVDFGNAQIVNADLSYSTFDGCRFISTTIEDTYFEESEFRNSLFDHAGAVVGIGSSSTQQEDYQLPQNVISRFRGFTTKFIGTEIKNTLFLEADLRFTRFEGVSFSNSQFSRTDLSGAVFENTDLSGVVFDDVDLTGADLQDTLGLTEVHLSKSCGSDATKLPEGFTIKKC